MTLPPDAGQRKSAAPRQCHAWAVPVPRQQPSSAAGSYWPAGSLPRRTVPASVLHCSGYSSRCRGAVAGAAAGSGGCVAQGVPARAQLQV
jgi:hypothetical protein